MSMRALVLCGVASAALMACQVGDQAGEAALETPVPSVPEDVSAPSQAVDAAPEVSIEVVDAAAIVSPDGSNQISFETQGGLLRYSVTRGNETIVAPSRLGLRFAEGFGLDDNLEIIGTETASVDAQWEQPWGERRVVRDRHEELLVKARRAPTDTSPDIRFNIRVRAFDDGVAFRYEIPAQDGLPSTLSIMDELTEFNVGRETESWWIPSRMYNRYEYH